jgi:Ser/Thr protein kinase RdoA (MazF antagonist)
LFDDNVLYHNEQFQAIIDFEDACYYDRAYDIGSALFGTCITDETLDFDKAGRLVEGYQEISNLEEVEMASIQFFTVYAGTAISAWRYQTYNLRKPNPAKQNRHMQAVRRMDRIRQIPGERFRELLKV